MEFHKATAVLQSNKRIKNITPLSTNMKDAMLFTTSDNKEYLVGKTKVCQLWG